MSEDLVRKLDLARRSLTLAGRFTQIRCWTSVAELAMVENNEKIFDMAADVLLVLEPINRD